MRRAFERPAERKGRRAVGEHQRTEFVVGMTTSQQLDVIHTVSIDMGQFNRYS